MTPALSPKNSRRNSKIKAKRAAEKQIKQTYHFGIIDYL